MLQSSYMLMSISYYTKMNPNSTWYGRIIVGPHYEWKGQERSQMLCVCVCWKTEPLREDFKTVRLQTTDQVSLESTTCIHEWKATARIPCIYGGYAASQVDQNVLKSETIYASPLCCGKPIVQQVTLAGKDVLVWSFSNLALFILKTASLWFCYLFHST